MNRQSCESIRSALLIAIGLLGSAQANSEWFAAGLESVKIEGVADHQPDTEIKGLVWDQATLTAEIQDKAERKAVAYLAGHFKQRGGNLLYQFEKIPVDPKSGAFRIPVRLTGLETAVALAAVSADGELKQSQLKLVTRLRQGAELPGNEKRHQLFARTGVSILRYTEAINSIAVTNTGIPLEVGYQFALFPGKFALGAELGIVALRLGAVGAVGASPWSGNLRAKYRFPWLKDPWVWTGELDFLMRGMLTVGSAYGFSFLGMPAIALGIARDFGPVHRASFRLTYAPLQPAFGISFAQRALIAEVGYERDLTAKLRWTADLRLESINFDGTTGTATVPVVYTQWAVLGGVRF